MNSSEGFLLAWVTRDESMESDRSWPMIIAEQLGYSFLKRRSSPPHRLLIGPEMKGGVGGFNGLICLDFKLDRLEGSSQ